MSASPSYNDFPRDKKALALRCAEWVLVHNIFPEFEFHPHPESVASGKGVFGVIEYQWNGKRKRVRACQTEGHSYNDLLLHMTAGKVAACLGLAYAPSAFDCDRDSGKIVQYSMLPFNEVVELGELFSAGSNFAEIAEEHDFTSGNYCYNPDSKKWSQISKDLSGFFTTEELELIIFRSNRRAISAEIPFIAWAGEIADLGTNNLAVDLGAVRSLANRIKKHSRGGKSNFDVSRVSLPFYRYDFLSQAEADIVNILPLERIFDFYPSTVDRNPAKVKNVFAPFIDREAMEDVLCRIENLTFNQIQTMVERIIEITVPFFESNIKEEANRMRKFNAEMDLLGVSCIEYVSPQQAGRNLIFHMMKKREKLRGHIMGRYKPAALPSGNENPFVEVKKPGAALHRRSVERDQIKKLIL